MLIWSCYFRQVHRILANPLDILGSADTGILHSPITHSPPNIARPSAGALFSTAIQSIPTVDRLLLSRTEVQRPNPRMIKVGNPSLSTEKLKLTNSSGMSTLQSSILGDPVCQARRRRE